MSSQDPNPISVAIRVSSSFFQDVVPEFTVLYETDRVANLKALVRDSLPEPRPDESNMIFIFRGRILDEKDKIKDLVGQLNGDSAYVTFHMLVRWHMPNQTAGSKDSAGSAKSQATPSGTSSSDRSQAHPINSTENMATRVAQSTTTLNSSKGTSDGSIEELKDLVATDGYVTVNIPAYEYLLLDGQSDGEKAFALAPPALKQIEEAFGPRHGLDTVALHFVPKVAQESTRYTPGLGSSIRLSSEEIPPVTVPETTRTGEPTNGNNFAQVANNRFFRLDLNHPQVSRILRSGLFSLSRLCVLGFFLFMKGGSDVTKALVLLMAALLLAHEYGVFEGRLSILRQRLIDNLPHGLPRDVRLELYSHIWDRQETEVTEDDDDSTDSDEEVNEISSVINSDRRLPATLKSMICIFFGSLHPAIYTLWTREEDRRRREVADNIREFRRAAEERRINEEDRGMSTSIKTRENEELKEVNQESTNEESMNRQSVDHQSIDQQSSHSTISEVD